MKKKYIWVTLLILSIGLVAFSVTRFDTSAAEAELYMDVLLDIDDQEYENIYRRPHGGMSYRQPLAFIGLGEEVKASVLEQAALYGVEPSEYVLAITVSTYSEAYDFDTVIETIQNADEATLVTYLDELKAFLESNADAIKETLDGIRESIQPQLEAIRETYMDEVKDLLSSIKNADDEATRLALTEELDRLKEDIQAEVAIVKLALTEALEENNIAIEGLYGLFMMQQENPFEARMAMFEKRFPRLYNRIKEHFNKD